MHEYDYYPRHFPRARIEMEQDDGGIYEVYVTKIERDEMWFSKPRLLMKIEKKSTLYRDDFFAVEYVAGGYGIRDLRNDVIDGTTYYTEDAAKQVILRQQPRMTA